MPASPANHPTALGQAPIPAQSTLRTSPRSLLAMVLLALALRLAVMAFLYPEQLNVTVEAAHSSNWAADAAIRDHWRFGYETGRIARSIVLGKGFSSPLYGDTGPTAMLPPVYPYIVAGFFHIFGIYTRASAIAILSFQSLISALTCLPVFFIARRTFGERAAVWAGWAWAIFPYAVYFSVERIWGTWLATLLFSLLFLMTLQLSESSKRGRWVRYGLVWGLAGLTEPMVLSVLIPLGCWACYRLHRRQRRWLAGAAISALAFVLTVTPWFVRNYREFHQFVPFRDGFGLSLVLGTKADTAHWAVYGAGIGPWHSKSEWDEFVRLGELGYMRREQRLAVESIRQYPGWFAWRTARRVLFLWTGYWSFDRAYLAEEPLDPVNIPVCTALTVLALLGLFRLFQRDRGLGVLYALTIAIFPLIYYTTSPETYYRRPLDAVLVVLAACYLASCGDSPATLAPTEDSMELAEA